MSLRTEFAALKAEMGEDKSFEYYTATGERLLKVPKIAEIEEACNAAMERLGVAIAKNGCIGVADGTIGEYTRHLTAITGEGLSFNLHIDLDNGSVTPDYAYCNNVKGGGHVECSHLDLDMNRFNFVGSIQGWIANLVERTEKNLELLGKGEGYKVQRDYVCYPKENRERLMNYYAAHPQARSSRKVLETAKGNRDMEVFYLVLGRTMVENSFDDNFADNPQEILLGNWGKKEMRDRKFWEKLTERIPKFYEANPKLEDGRFWDGYYPKAAGALRKTEPELAEFIAQKALEQCPESWWPQCLSTTVKIWKGESGRVLEGYEGREIPKGKVGQILLGAPVEALAHLWAHVERKMPANGLVKCIYKAATSGKPEHLRFLVGKMKNSELKLDEVLLSAVHAAQVGTALEAIRLGANWERAKTAVKPAAFPGKKDEIMLAMAALNSKNSLATKSEPIVAMKTEVDLD